MLEGRIRAFPMDRFARYELALEQGKLGDFVQAELGLRAVVRDWPTAGAAWLQLGQLLIRMERLDSAREAFTDGLGSLEGVDSAEARRGRRELQDALEEMS